MRILKKVVAEDVKIGKVEVDVDEKSVLRLFLIMQS